MGKLKSLMYGLGLGAGLMYFWDPERGNRRRALVRDQVVSMRHDADRSLATAMEDMRNRTRGILAETMATVSNEGAPDWLLVERAKAEIGRHVRHAGAVEIDVDGGRLILRGPALKDEVEDIVRAATRVRGVKGVENQMDIHETPENIPALQGTRREKRVVPEWQQENWSPSMRLLSSVGGGMLALYGLTRKGLIGTSVGMAGLGLAARGVTNTDLRGLLGMTKERDVIRINKAINIDAPVEEIYRFWTNFENFPKFMGHLLEVRDLGNGRSHWVAAGPGGTKVEWDAIVTNQEPNGEIAWESVAGSEVKTQGKVHFTQNERGGTRVTVLLHYTPPAGALGHAVATLFGKNPKQAMDEDLVRLKSLFEEGETTVKGRKLTGPDLAAAT